MISCSKDDTPKVAKYLSKNIIVVVIDGARLSETWGGDTHQYIPHLANDLAPLGVVYNQFYNLGVTKTNPGHTAITTGNYQVIDNSGEQLPEQPSIFQYWLKATGKTNTSAWVIAGKDKLEILANTENPEWHNISLPSTNCGPGGQGLGSGFRNDMLTFESTKEILSDFHPQLVLINLIKPDSAGHDGEWDNYLKGIREADTYIFELWNMIQSDPFYKDRTTLLITNDHGRHLDDIKDGFISHGDDCEGCRHINLFALGPDIKKGIVSDTPRELIDISATIAEILDFDMPTGHGKIMKELLK